MECNIEEIGGQIGESSSGEIVIRAHGKDEKEWQDWLQDFSIEIEHGLDRTQYVPSCSRATFRRHYVCQHNKAVHSSKRRKNSL